MEHFNVIASSARIGEDLSIGNYCIVEENVTIGRNVSIGNGVIIYRDTVIRDNVVIQDNAIIGKMPVKAKNSIANALKKDQEEISPAVIQDRCIIGTSTILYRGCTLGKDCYVADQAAVRERVYVGEKTIVGRGVLIENDCRIGRMCKIESNAYITAYSYLEDYVFIAPGVVTTNDNFLGRTKDRIKYMKGITVKRGGRIGANSTLLPGKVIGEDAVVAAGSVVTRNAEDKTIIKGNPAKPYKKVPEEQLLENNLK
jgi:hypothetical protein